MKRNKILWMLATLMFLSGCSGKLPLASSFHAVESMEMVRMVCIDREEDSVLLTACGDPQENGQTNVWESEGKTFGEALERLSMHPGKELIFSHVDYLVFGKDITGEDIRDVLDYGAKATEIRLNCKLFWFPSEKVDEIAGRTGKGETALTVQLDQIIKRLPNLQEGQVYTAGETITELGESDCGLVLQLEDGETGLVCPVGYNVITLGGESFTLSPEESKGVTLIRNKNVRDWMVLEKNGSKILVEYTVAETKSRQGKNEVDICASGKAEILEQIGDFPRQEAECAIEEMIRNNIRAAIDREHKLGIDFLSLPWLCQDEQEMYNIEADLLIQTEGETLKGEGI